MKLKSKIGLTILSLMFIVLFQAFPLKAAFYDPGPVNFKPSITIPGSKFTKNSSIEMTNDSTILAEYLKAIYTYSISIVGIVATIMLMFGGFTWLTAGGSGEKVGKARDIIFGSLTGLVLALTSYTILTLISPNLVNFKKINITPPTEGENDIITCSKGADGNFDQCPVGKTCLNKRCLTPSEIEAGQQEVKGCCLSNKANGEWKTCTTDTTKHWCDSKSNISFGGSVFYTNEYCYKNFEKQCGRNPVDTGGTGENGETTINDVCTGICGN